MLRMTPLASAIVALLIGIEAYAAEETFDTHFMIGGMKDQQVSNIRLEDNQPLPGPYDIDIYVNKQWRGKYEIIVKDNPQETCLSREMIKRLGINTDSFASGKQCLTFKQLIQGGSYTWDIGVFRLDFSVPQAWVEDLESGYVPPENWERGINAFYTSYYVSQYYSDYKASGNSKSTYVRFNSGLNLQGGNCILMPVSVKQITIQGCGKAIPCIWNVDLPNFSARFVWVICTHQAIFLILFASAVCGCFVICRCCLTRNKILRHGCRGLLRVTRW